MTDISFEIFEDAPFMFHSIDNNGIIIKVSEEWLYTLGYSRDEVVGRPSTDFLTKESKRYAEKVILPKFFKTGQCKSVHYQFVKKDGNIVDILLSATSQIDENGKVINSLAFLTDVTGQEIINDLIETKEMYRTLSRVSPVGIFRTDNYGRCQYVNAKWRELAGMTSEEALDDGWIKAIHPDDLEVVKYEWSKCVRTGDEFYMEYRFKSPDGVTTWLIGQANHINGGGKGLVGTITNITHKKELLPQLLDLQKLIKTEATKRSIRNGS